MYDYRLLFPRLAEQELRREADRRRDQSIRRIELVRAEPRPRKERG